MNRLTAEFLKNHVALIDGKAVRTTGPRKGMTLKWVKNNRGYLQIGPKFKGSSVTIGLHQLAYATATGDYDLEGYVIDHIDRDITNNDPSNLRKTKQSSNQLNRKLDSNNTSGYKGVSYYKHAGKFAAKFKGKHLGLFVCPIEAAKAYDRAAEGTIATTNKSLGLI